MGLWRKKRVEYTPVEQDRPSDAATDDLYVAPPKKRVLKLVLAGECGVGKSSMLMQFSEGTFLSFYISTVGIDFRSKPLTVNGEKMMVQVWDLSGDTRYRELITAYFRGASGVLLVFDLHNPDTFAPLPHWMEILKEDNPHIPVHLVGNKVDLGYPSSVPSPAIAAFIAEHECRYSEISAKSSADVGRLFLDVAANLRPSLPFRPPPPPRPKDSFYQRLMKVICLC